MFAQVYFLIKCFSHLVCIIKDTIIQVIEIWFCRMILKILQTERVSNKEVSKEMATEGTHLLRIRKKQLNFLRYIT